MVNVKTLYKKKQLTVDELIKKHRGSGKELKELIVSKMKLLTLSEREICKLLIQGKSNKEIAEERFTGVGTVKSHLNNIYKKLGTNNRVEVINLVGRNLTFL